MAGLGRKIGVVGFLLSVGIACTQLFGERQNTLAPPPGKPPSLTTQTAPDPTREAFALAVCATGQMRCEGALLQTCADDLASWVTLQRCAAAALCQSSPAACLAATCSENEMTCTGALLQKCNTDRTGWDLFATCLSPAHCNADQRQCMPEPCAAGQRRCDRSELDQSPVLEVCRDDRLDWGPLDSCVTRELCDQTLTGGVQGGGLIVGTDGMVQLQAPTTPDTLLKCNLPACNVGEVRCEGSQLELCSEGRTEWTLVEECASPALCEGSVTNLSPAGTPQCLPPGCAVNEHQCAEGGVLQVCSEDRTGFRLVQACIGPPFCNAALANSGQEGCTPAPCVAGAMQCNGAQIQVCREDRTALDNTGEPCESAALCNADDPQNAFCEEAACRRGGTSGDEFQCEGALLQRCNDSLTGYDTLQTCVTPALCDASQRFDGCRPPACQPGQHACSPDGFLQTCNADQTGFDDTENCGSRAQCDANAGRCSDPCQPGAVRCNSQSGDSEECRDLLTGWQTTADCLSLPLCDAANRRCNPPACAAGALRCQNGQIQRCNAGLAGFDTVQQCANGCNAGSTQCNQCSGNASSCVNGDIQRCVNGFFQNTDCGVNGCNAGSTTCSACTGNGASCVGGDIQRCVNGFFQNTDCGANGCNAGSTTCNVCSGNGVNCVNGDIQRCVNGAFQTTDCGANGCNAGSTTCNACSGNAASCVNGDIQRCVNGAFQNTDCGANGCNAGSTTCNQCSGNGVNCVNGDIQRCVNGFFQNTDCGAPGCNAGSTTCNACSGNAASCVNNDIQRCVNGAFQTTDCGANGCNANSTTCNACSGNAASCVNNDIQRCVNGAFQTTDCGANGCNANSTTCNACSGNAASCVNGDIQRCVNGAFQTTDCGAPGCNANSTTCNACSGNAASCVNGDIQRCVNGAFQTTDCGAPGCNANSTTCNACSGNAASCVNGDIQRCVNGAFQNTDCGAPGCNVGNTTCNECAVAGDCDDDNNACTTAACTGGQCFNNPIAGCTTCNFTGTRCVPNGLLGTCTGGRLTTSPCANGCTNSGSACNTFCVPGSMTCSRNIQPQRCRADGSTFDNIQTCNVATGVLSLCEGPLASGLINFFQFSCDDGDPCTVDSCAGGATQCTNTLPATGRGTGCACTNSDQCQGICGQPAGVCVATPR